MSDGEESSDGGDDGIPTWAILLVIVVVAIPVLLMVTVILAAVIGAFVLGFGGGGAAAPVTDWGATGDPAQGTVTFEHQEGDTIEREHLEVTVNGEPTSDWEVTGDSLTVGDTIVVRGVEPGDEVELVWDDGESRQIQAIHRL